jgi:hypothetical protein
MKSLSIFLVLGTLTALILGTLFAVSPALALNQDADPGADAVAVALQAAADQLPVAAAETELEASPVTGADLGSVQAVAVAEIAPVNVSLEKEAAPVQVAQVEPQANEQAVAVAEAAPGFDSFVASVVGGNAARIAGIYVDGVLALAVTGQGGDAAYVSGNANEATQFGLAAQYGSNAFLAHNYLAGADFFKLSTGQVITLVYGDGSSKDFRIQEIGRYQALQPNSTQSNFVDLDGGENLSATDLFHTIYNSDHPVVLQTCIENEGISTWGRLFVIAVPLS